MSTMGWSDAWRSRNPESREFTWFSRPHNNGFRLDHAFLSPSLVPRLASVQYAHETRRPGVTDHSGLVVDVHADDSEVGANVPCSSAIPTPITAP